MDYHPEEPGRLRLDHRRPENDPVRDLHHRPHDQLIAIHPCRGLKTPTVARKPRTVITPEQFDAIHAALPSPRRQAMVELDIESGLRWGELTELRARDLNITTRMLTVARAVVEISRRGSSRPYR